jgi:MFS family permease
MLGTITLGITGCLGALAGGALADRWGIRPVVIASRIGLMIVLFPVMKFLVANPSATTLVLAITILSLLHAAGVAVVVALTPLIFPPGIRSTGLALTYAVGVAIFGGTATYVITWLVGVTGDPLASTYYVMAANVVVLLAALAIRNSDTTAAASRRRFWTGIAPKKPNSTDLDRASQFTPIRLEGPWWAEAQDQRKGARPPGRLYGLSG